MKRERRCCIRFTCTLQGKVIAFRKISDRRKGETFRHAIFKYKGLVFFEFMAAESWLLEINVSAARSFHASSLPISQSSQSFLILRITILSETLQSTPVALPTTATAFPLSHRFEFRLSSAQYQAFKSSTRGWVKVQLIVLTGAKETPLGAILLELRPATATLTAQQLATLRVPAPTFPVFQLVISGHLSVTTATTSPESDQLWLHCLACRGRFFFRFFFFLFGRRARARSASHGALRLVSTQDRGACRGRCTCRLARTQAGLSGFVCETRGL